MPPPPGNRTLFNLIQGLLTLHWWAPLDRLTSLTTRSTKKKKEPTRVTQVRVQHWDVHDDKHQHHGPQILGRWQVISILLAADRVLFTVQ